MSDTNNKVARGLRAGELEAVFRQAGVLREALESAKSEQSKATIIGNFLSRNLNRPVNIAVREKTGKAVLRQEYGANRSKLYYFEVEWDEASPPLADFPPPVAASVPGAMAVPQSSPVNLSTLSTTPAVVPPAIHDGPITLAGGNTEQW